MTSHKLQHTRLGDPALFRASGAALISVCIAIALPLGVAASPTPSPGPSFAAAKNYVTGPEPYMVAIGDLNGDGKGDLATASGDAVSVRLSRSDGSFQARRDYQAGSLALAIGDLNGDRRPDLVTAGIDVLLNRGDGSFRFRRTYRPGRCGASSVAIADLNGDRKPDLAAANSCASRRSHRYTVSALFNKGGGRFRSPLAYPTGDSPNAIALSDVNGDGKRDIVTANEDDTVSVLLNRGDGRFRAKRDYRTGPGPNALAIGDLNGDGKLDVVVANLGYEGNTVSVLQNRGNGTFRRKRDYRTGGTDGVVIGDLNGDRKPDIATANGNNADTVSVLANRGDGRFPRKLDYRTPSAFSLAIGDLNGDGELDLAGSNDDANTVSVLINTPGLCVVQDVRRMTLRVAARMLGRVNCQVGEVGSDHSRYFKRGRVMWQKPGPGAVRPNRTAVDVVLSVGPKGSS